MDLEPNYMKPVIYLIYISLDNNTVKIIQDTKQSHSEKGITSLRLL